MHLAMSILKRKILKRDRTIAFLHRSNISRHFLAFRVLIELPVSVKLEVYNLVSHGNGDLKKKFKYKQNSVSIKKNQ